MIRIKWKRWETVEEEMEKGIKKKKENRPGTRALAARLSTLNNHELLPTCHDVTSDSARVQVAWAARAPGVQGC